MASVIWWSKFNSSGIFKRCFSSFPVESVMSSVIRSLMKIVVVLEIGVLKEKSQLCRNSNLCIPVLQRSV